jgi:hypothetical protein
MIKIRRGPYIEDLFVSIGSFLKKIDNLFSTLSLSFYSILVAALIGAIVNVVTGLILARTINMKSAIGIIILLVIPGLLIYFYIYLEKLQKTSRNDYDYKDKIKTNLSKIHLLVILILTLFVASIIIIYFGLQEYEVGLCQNMRLKENISSGNLLILFLVR